MTETKRRVPALRFPGFDGEWRNSKLEEISKKPQYGLNAPAVDYDGVNGYIRITDIEESTHTFIKENITSPSSFSEEYLLNEDDLLFARTGASVGKSYFYKKADGKLYFAGFLIRFVIDKAYPKFVFYYTQLPSYDKWVLATSMRSGQPGINAEEYSSFKMRLPSIREQEKIAEFLSAVDERIGLLKRRKQELETYKRGVMQQIFSRRLRFKAPNGNDYPEWKETKLGRLITQSSDRNKNGTIQTVLSVSNKKGFVKQLEQFDGYSIASDDTANYKIVKRNYFAYNPSRINVGSIACLRNEDLGIVSPMYVVFKLSNDLNSIFLQNLLQTYRIKHLIKVGCSGSVRDSLNFEVLAEFDISLPSINEQQKIADFLSAIDNKIELCERQITDIEKFKKGLLQQMFV